jgi:hypothetical protein
MRKQWDLNGTWKFQIDCEDKGETNEWYQHGLQQSMEMVAPHIWQREENLINYKGIAWYERQFSHLFSRENGNKLFLYFGAVDYHSRIWVNGQFVGEHEGGFTPFEFDITKYLVHDADNTLTVRVYDPEDNAEIPIGKQGSWYTRVSGIWQEVYLEERSSIFIKNLFITPDIENQQITADLTLNGSLEELTGQEKFYYTIKNHLEKSKALIEGSHPVTGRVTKFEVDIPNPILWEPNHPHLYEIEVRMEGKSSADAYTDTFGMRKIEQKNGNVILNGHPLYIRGSLDQAFYPDTIYTAPSDDYIQNEIQLAKEMGFNLLRKHIKIEIPRYLYWADRLGMLIWAETPNYVKWTKVGQRRFRNELMKMIRRDFNHPSIIIWSVYNEEWGLEWDLANDAAKQEHVLELFNEVKEIDPTRLVCDNSGWNHVKTDINDFHSYFVSPDQSIAWRKELDEKMIGNPNGNFVKGYQSNNEPIIVSEFGVWGLPSVVKIKEYYKGEPWWFINQGEESHQEDYKMPITAKRNYGKYGLNKVFHSFEDISIYSQKRMFRAIKSIIEEMRKRPKIAGYVVTEFTDIEWETNGWLDFLRNPKFGFERLKDFNGSLVIMADNVKNNLWSGEKQNWDIVISNNELKSFDGIVKWHLTGLDVNGEMPVEMKGEPYLRLNNLISFTVPLVKNSGFYTLQIELSVNGETFAENNTELTITPKRKASSFCVYPYKMGEQFIDKLLENGYRIHDSYHDDSIIVTNQLDQNILQSARNGGNVLFLAENGDHLEEKGQFTFRHLPEGESWQRTSSFNYVDTEQFPGIPLHPEMGWEVDGLIPNYIVPFANHSKIGGVTGRTVHMFGNTKISESYEVLSGYFEGWLGQMGGSIFKQRTGKGEITVVTWKLIDQYGIHPIATLVLNQLIGNLSK